MSEHKQTIPDWLRKQFEGGYVPTDEPPGLEERAYRDWVMEGTETRPHPARMSTAGTCVLCGNGRYAVPHNLYEVKAADRPPAGPVGGCGPADTWAVVELMGHVRLAGRLSEVERFGGKLARLDVPQADGSFVTQFFGAAGVYRITFVSEAVARHVAKGTSAAPVQPWDFPKALNSPADPLDREPPATVPWCERFGDDGDDDADHDDGGEY